MGDLYNLAAGAPFLVYGLTCFLWLSFALSWFSACRQKKILMAKPSGSFSILPASGTAGRIKIYALRRLNKIMLMPIAPRAALLGSGTTSHEMDCKPTPSDSGLPYTPA